MVDGTEYSLRTRPLNRSSLDSGQLVPDVMRDRPHWDLLGIAAKILDGRWKTDKRVRTYDGQTLQVFSSRFRTMGVMCDGEVTDLTMPLRYEIEPKALAMLAPGLRR